jgi:hypothetical protein
VLDETSLVSYQAFDLWLYDQYEKRITDLPRLHIYGTETELFAAAAAEEVDALVIGDDARTGVAEVWTHPAGAEDEGGGFGRQVSVWEEVPVLDATERLYGMILAAAPKQDLADPRFTAALEQVLGQLVNERPDMHPVLGAENFVPVETKRLNTTARLVALNE